MGVASAFGVLVGLGVLVGAGVGVGSLSLMMSGSARRWAGVGSVGAAAGTTGVSAGCGVAVVVAVAVLVSVGCGRPTPASRFVHQGLERKMMTETEQLISTSMAIAANRAILERRCIGNS